MRNPDNTKNSCTPSQPACAMSANGHNHAAECENTSALCGMTSSIAMPRSPSSAGIWARAAMAESAGAGSATGCMSVEVPHEEGDQLVAIPVRRERVVGSLDNGDSQLSLAP